MRRFQLSSPSIEGYVVFTYKADGLLCHIDLVNATLTQELTKSIKRFIPERVSDIETAFAKTTATIIECDFEVTFDMFWKDYDRKINRKRCEPLFNGLSKTKQVKAWAGIKAYDKYLKKESWRPKADPDTYLRQEYWENEWK